MKRWWLPDSMTAFAIVFFLAVFFTFLAMIWPDCSSQSDSPSSPYAVQKNGHGKFRVVYVHDLGYGVKKEDERRVCDTQEQAEAYKMECIHSDSVNAAQRELDKWNEPTGAERVRAARAADPTRKSQ